MDLVAVTAEITSLNAAQVVVGGLILVSAAIAFAYSWLKAMFF